MKNLVRYDTPTKFIGRVTRTRFISTGVDQAYRRKVGLMEHKRFEKAAPILFSSEAVSRRNEVNKRFLSVVLLSTIVGGIILLTLK